MNEDHDDEDDTKETRDIGYKIGALLAIAGPLIVLFLSLYEVINSPA